MKLLRTLKYDEVSFYYSFVTTEKFENDFGYFVIESRVLFNSLVIFTPINYQLSALLVNISDIV